MIKQLHEIERNHNEKDWISKEKVGSLQRHNWQIPNGEKRHKNSIGTGIITTDAAIKQRSIMKKNQHF